MTITMLAILLHHRRFSFPYRPPVDPATISLTIPCTVDEEYGALVSRGLIEEVGAPGHYVLTDKGSCHVGALLNAPLPTCAWTSVVPC